MKKRLVSLPLLAVIATMVPGCSSKQDSVVLFTNDVHCAVDQIVDKADSSKITQMGYASVASYKKEMKKLHGDSNVVLVDNGDHLQGGVYGTLTAGKDIVNAMNAAGYDMAIPGNHEFDYGMDVFLDYANKEAKYSYVSTNFVHNGETVFSPYKIQKLGGRKVAFLGATTPDTYTSSTPKYFKDDSGNYVYNFSEGSGRTGTPLYETIQKTVDHVKKKEKADYVVLMAHLGIDAENAPYRSTDVIKNTTGIDVVLDGHSHSTIVGDSVKNKDDKDVILTSTGTKLASIGKLTIGKDGSLKTELVTNYSKQDDEEAKKAIDKIIADTNSKTTEVAAKSTFDLIINNIEKTTVAKRDSEGNETSETEQIRLRRIRRGETNLGDLTADAYQAADNADFAFVNGGGIRAEIKAGDITLKQVLNVQTFNNKYETYKAKGSDILNFLEFSVKSLPTRADGGVDFTGLKWDSEDKAYKSTGEFGGYMHCSKGLKYKINTKVDSPIIIDDKKLYSGVREGAERRVSDVQVASEYNSDGSVKTFVSLDPNKEYKFGAVSYYIENQGDGYNMFKLGKNCTKVTEVQKLDYEVVFDFFKNLPKTSGESVPTVPNTYSEPYGAGRITYVV